MKIEIDLTDAAAKELIRISERTGIPRAKVIQKSFNLFRAYLAARDNSDEWAIVPSTSEIDYDELSRVTVPGIKL